MRVNHLPVDGWAVLHFAVAYLIAVYLPLDILQFTIINVVWEIIEITILKHYIPKILRKHMSIEIPINTLFDILIAEMGWVVGHYVIFGTLY